MNDGGLMVLFFGFILWPLVLTIIVIAMICYGMYILAFPTKKDDARKSSNKKKE